MRKFVIFLGACFIVGELAVASNPSYYYGVVSLVLAFVAGCWWLMSQVLPLCCWCCFSVLGQSISGFYLSCLWQWSPFQNRGGI
ncbi:NU6M oxidoreductase, partial [Brachypodius atriceps]|nr:NU6M oxidoreductase [Brachypodius atriceps]